MESRQAWKRILLKTGFVPKSMESSTGTSVTAQPLLNRPYVSSLMEPKFILLEEYAVRLSIGKL